MYGIPPVDPGKAFDWGKTSADYGQYRPGYPASFWRRLEALGVGLAGQRVVDVGTGTGVMAREFARRGCRVVGVDVSAGQVAEARRLAEGEGLRAEWAVAAAEETGLPGASWDLVSASQCWLYFDKARAIREVKRLLAPGGRLLTCHLCWLPRLDAIVQRWIVRTRDVEAHTGCVYSAGAFELDDREGPLRDHLHGEITRWRAALRRTIVQAVESGDLRSDTDPEQLVAEIYALMLGLIHDTRFLRDPRAAERAQASWQRLARSYRP